MTSALLRDNPSTSFINEADSRKRFYPLLLTKLLKLGYSETEILIYAKYGLIDFVTEEQIYNVPERSFTVIRTAMAFDGPKRDFILDFGTLINFQKFRRRLPKKISKVYWRRYVIRERNWESVKVYGKGKKNQKYYGSYMRCGTLMAQNGILNKAWTFRQTLAVLAYFRHVMAIKLGHLNFDEYGLRMRKHKIQERKARMKTKLNKRYKELAERVETLTADECGKQFFKRKDYKTKIKIQSYGYIKNKRISLSFFSLKKENYIIHASPKYVHEILDYVDKLYHKAMRAQDQFSLDKKLGEIFWWICKAKPWVRGDPSIAEMFIKTIYRLKGFAPPAWKAGIIPWVEVESAFDVKAFAKNFSRLLDRSI